MCQLGVSYKVAIYLPCPFYTKLASTVYSPSHSTMLRFDEISSNIDIFLGIVSSLEKCPPIIVSAAYQVFLLQKENYFVDHPTCANITCGLYIFNPLFFCKNWGLYMLFILKGGQYLKVGYGEEYRKFHIPYARHNDPLLITNHSLHISYPIFEDHFLGFTKVV